MDLAIGIMIGAAFNSLVQSLVKDILTPIIGIFLGKADLSNWALEFSIPDLGLTGEQIVKVTYGRFLQTALDFLILAIVIFALVKFVSRLKRKAEDETNTEVPPPKEIQLLSEIRDLLKKK